MNDNLKENAASASSPEEGLARLNRIMVLLRAQCPWDKKQTFETLRPLTIEETFELSDAILDNDSAEICEELGDVIMHIAFYARVAEEENRFTFTDILNKICEKLIRRHPHIFSDEVADTDEDVKKAWEKIKLTEGKKHSVLAGVPRSLPSMIKACRIQDKARGVGFDWDDRSQVWNKVMEELMELKEAVGEMDVAASASDSAAVSAADSAAVSAADFAAVSVADSAAVSAADFAAVSVAVSAADSAAVSAADSAAVSAADFAAVSVADSAAVSVADSAVSAAVTKAKVEDELGDLFFSLINYARFLGIHPDDALEHTNRKFINRFKYLEEQTIMKGKSLHDMTLDEMNYYWDKAKVIERTKNTGSSQLQEAYENNS